MVVLKKKSENKTAEIKLLTDYPSEILLLALNISKTILKNKRELRSIERSLLFIKSAIQNRKSELSNYIPMPMPPMPPPAHGPPSPFRQGHRRSLLPVVSIKPAIEAGVCDPE